MTDVLITADHLLPYLAELNGQLQDAGLSVRLPPTLAGLSENELIELVPGIAAIICGDQPITRNVIDAASSLKVICKWGTGIDSIDSEYAQDRGIKVMRTPNAFTPPVADTTLAFIAYFMRSVGVNDASVRHGQWTASTTARAFDEVSLGVIGLGNIGQLVASRAHALGMSCYVYDVDPSKAAICDGLGAVWATLDDLLRRSDFVSIHCPLTAQNRKLIDARRLGLMKATSVLINTSRGALIDEDALIAALQSNQIGGVALDVFATEPLPLASPLRELANVVLSPHSANASPKYHKLISENTIKMLIAALRTSV